MIKMKDSISKFNITRDNNHLIDVISTEFLELGNINYLILERLLNYELVNIEDITFYPIQNNGIGKSTVNDSELKNLIPFLFFDNLNAKNKSLQLFITYGLIKMKNENNREIFTPIILIPINLYIENDKIFVQQISRPVENPILISFLAQIKNIMVSIPEKLDNLYTIDKFCMGFERHGELNLKLENYLTFAYLREKEIKINHDKFAIAKYNESFLYDKLYATVKDSVYYSRLLNRTQRAIIHSAFEGQNIVITGRHGTGKTTTLLNIAINAIHQDRRVLYISNMRETLDDVYHFFENKKMHQYVTNLSKSFASFHQGELIITPKNVSVNEDYENLLQNYQYINDYESSMTARILDHRFIDVVNQLIILQNKDVELLEIGNLRNLYKHEYLEVVKALENIESAIGKIDNLQNSIWKNVPIINNIQYPNQVISLIYQIHKSYSYLQSVKEKLEIEYGFKEISNYAFLKTLIFNYKGLNINDVPKSWKEPTFKVFAQAKEEYRNLKNEIYQLQEMEYFINHKYDNYENLDIDSEIEHILGPFFTENDLDKVDKIIRDRMNLVVKINKSLAQIDIFQKSLSKVMHVMNWHFEPENKIINELTKLNEIIHRPHINSKFINIVTKGVFEEIYKLAEQILIQIENDKEELKSYSKILPKVKDVELLDKIDLIEKYHNSEQIINKSDYKIIANLNKNQDFTHIIKSIKRVRELRDAINISQDKFIQLVGYKADRLVLEDLTNFNIFVKSLPIGVIKNKIIKFLNRMCDVSNSNYRMIRNNFKSFELLKRSCNEINDLYSFFQNYQFADFKEEYIDKINDIKIISSYLQKAYASNDRIYILTKSTNDKYIKPEEYFKFKKSIYKIKAAKNALKSNEKYAYLYQDLYHDHHTNINTISTVLQAFSLYIQCFEDHSKMLDSLDETNHGYIFEELKKCNEVTTSLDQTFTMFFRIYKDDVSKYYYDSFINNINRLSILLNSKEELIIYLNITENLQVLSSYKLDKFINYIINSKSQNLINNFKFTYFTMLKDYVLEKYPDLEDYHFLENSLMLTIKEEKALIDNIENKVFKNIKRNSGMRFSVLGIKNLDYRSYIKRTNQIKKLFLSTTQIVNNFLNIHDFDLVIIDDAHLLSANEYYHAIEAFQVIIAGEYQLHSTIANNLISRLRPTYNLNYRFVPTPKNLLFHMRGLKGVIRNNYHENFGIELIFDKLIEYICLLFKDNNDYKINLFIGGFDQQRLVFEQLTNLFLENGYSNDQIIEIYNNKLNICDLSLGYLYDADYNILYLDDYYKIDVEHVVANMIDNLLLCRKKLIIYDYNNLLSSGSNFHFIESLNRIVSNEEVFFKNFTSALVKNLAIRLEEKGLNVYSSNNELTFILEKNSVLYGIILFWDDNNINYETLNDYRDYYLTNLKYNFKIILIWSMELLASIEKAIDKILAEIDHV